MVETGRETLPEVQIWSGHTSGGPELVRTPSRKSGMGTDTLPKVRN